MTWVTIAAFVVVLLVTAGLLGHLERPLTWLGETWRRLRRVPPEPVHVPVEQLADDLRRLADMLERTWETDQPAKVERLRAAALAYDYVLLAACRTLELPQPKKLPMDPIERLQTEAELARHGLSW